MKIYLIALAAYAALSFASLPTQAQQYMDPDSPLLRSPKTTETKPVYIPQVIEPLNTYGLQRRMNQQYQNQQLQDQLQQQQQQLQYQQHQEHMRNNGWGRPGLDGGLR